MYESFYKLRTAPFQLAANPLFFYDSDTHRNGLIRLRQAMEAGNGITVITGDPGAGKTELMRKFNSELDLETTVVATVPLTSLRSNNILDNIAASFGVVNMGFVGDALWSKSVLLAKIQQQLCSGVSEGKKFVVLVDNAESLNESSLDKLIQLCSVRSKGRALIQCFLFGEQTIKAKLDEVKLNHPLDNIVAAQIGSLNEQETRRYVEHRLLQAGWQGDPEITDAAYKMIHQVSEGVPWHINMLCHRVLLQGFLEDVHLIDKTLVCVFQTEKELENIGVVGSDVAISSNVVSLNNSRDYHETLKDGGDELINASDESQILITDVQDALDACMQEFNIQEEENNTRARKEIIKRDSVLDRILTGAQPVNDEVAHSVQFDVNKVEELKEAEQQSNIKLYPLMNLQTGHQPHNDSSLHGASDKQIPNSIEQWSGTSPMKIAMNASIATSVLITAMIALLSDGGPGITQLSELTSKKTSVVTMSDPPKNRINYVTPSPFENPNDAPRARAILK